MTQKFRITIFCPDQVGLIAAITGKLFDLGGNLGDTTFAVLGKGAEFTTVCSLPENIFRQEIYEQLKALPPLEQADITITPFTLQTVHGLNANITHRLTISGGDHPGLVARITEVFVEAEANIVRLNARTIPHPDGDRYQVEIEVWIPDANAASCLATVSNTSAALQLRCSVIEVDN